MEYNQLNNLKAAAKNAVKFAYAPYSCFHVGAAILTKSGKIFSGCNVENSSFGATICAERSAVSAAICAGEIDFEAIAIFVPGSVFAVPCGVCLQVLSEFSKNMSVICFCDTTEKIFTQSELLPYSFEYLKPN